MDVQQLDRLASISEEKCAGIVFAETGVLSGDATKLAQARDMIAAVAYKRNGGGVAPPVVPSEQDLKNPNTKAIWERCLKAAQNSANADVGNCKNFVVWYSDDNGKSPSKLPKEIKDKWPYEHKDKIQNSWGAFKMPFAPQSFPIAMAVADSLNLLNGPVDNIYVMQYCGVP